MPSVEELLSHYSPAVRALTRQTREVVLEHIPHAQEMVDHTARSIVFGHRNPESGPICAISPNRSHVKLVFYSGDTLPDPQGLLSGTGNGSRHVRLNSSRQALGSGVHDLLASAAGDHNGK